MFRLLRQSTPLETSRSTGPVSITPSRPTPPPILSTYLDSLPPVLTTTTTSSNLNNYRWQSKLPPTPEEMAATTTTVDISSQKYWGPVYWTFFHVFAASIVDDAAFTRCWPQMKVMVIESIVELLPCNACLDHGRTYLHRVQWSKITNREQLIEFFWLFHNFVNFRGNKPLFPRESLVVYESKSLQGAFFDLRRLIQTPGLFGRQKNLDRGFGRPEYWKRLHQFLQQYGTCFRH